MGIWGTGTLDNDSVQDFFAEIIETEEYLENVTKDELSKMLFMKIEGLLSEGDTSYELLGICEAISASLGKENPNLDEDYLELSQSLKSLITNEHIYKALSLLNEFISYEEKDDDWQTQEEKDDWLKNLKELKKRIS